MSLDILGTLQIFEKDGGISITPDVQKEFGAAIGTAIQQLFSGSIQIGGATFKLSGDSGLATVTGTGSAAPLLSAFSVTAVFTATGENVTMQFNGSIQGNIPLSDAWPAVLNGYPFNKLALTSGTLALDVNPGDTSFDLKISPTVSYEGTTLGTGLLEVQYENSELGFLGGFIAQGKWSPSTDIPVLQNLTITGTVGAFFSTITESDLSAFTGFPFVPDSIEPGLTFLAQIELDDSLSRLKDFLASGTTLQLTAIVPKDGGLSKASISAALAKVSPTGDFEISDLSLTWQSTSADSGTITLSVTATINFSAGQPLDITGTGTFVYGKSPSLDLGMTLSAPGGWLHPFGIPQLTIDSVAFALSLSDEGINIALAGEITIGTGPESVLLDVGAGLDDFEVPSFLAAELSKADRGKPVTLAALIDDFLPSLNLTSVPLLKDITFTDLKFWAVAAPIVIDGKNYQPGIGASGGISFFGYELDFAFCLITSPSVAVQAKGMISQNGGPIVITGGGITWLTISDSTGKLGASACIDTTASGYCTCQGGITNAYFCINGKISILGLANLSVVAAAASNLFELDVDLSVSTVFSDKLHFFLDPSSNNFAASVDMDFSPPDIVLGPYLIIPQFTIPTPKVSVCLALGTVVPTVAPCTDGWLPGSAPYFHFDLKFAWGDFNFNVDVDLDLSSAANAFNDFGKFLVNFLLESPKLVLAFLLNVAELAAKFLLWLGQEVLEVAKAIAAFFEMLFDDAFQLVSDIWDALVKVCAVVTGNDSMSSSVSLAEVSTPDGLVRSTQVATIPEVLAKLTDSPNGQTLLYHYYLHRDEADLLMRRNPEVRAIVQRHVESPEFASGVYLPMVIDVINVTAPQASPEFRQSAQEVITGLEPHRNKSYRELLVLLETT
jgi:hypothetical protein